MKIVLNKEPGGFRITKEMAQWLGFHRDWAIIPEEEINKDTIYIDPLRTLFKSKHGYRTENYSDINSFKFRSNKDLVDCVESLQEKHKDEDDDRNQDLRDLNSLKVTCINIQIVNIHDGIEDVRIG
jgi:hypothetical protein